MIGIDTWTYVKGVESTRWSGFISKSYDHWNTYGVTRRLFKTWESDVGVLTRKLFSTLVLCGLYKFRFYRFPKFRLKFGLVQIVQPKKFLEVVVTSLILSYPLYLRYYPHLPFVKLWFSSLRFIVFYWLKHFFSFQRLFTDSYLLSFTVIVVAITLIIVYTMGS